MNNIRSLALVWMVAALSVLAACNDADISERILYGYTAIENAGNRVADLREANLITDATRDRLTKGLRKALNALNLAKTYHLAKNKSAAEKQLILMKEILSSIQMQLTLYEGKKDG